MIYKTIDTATELEKEFVNYNRDYYSLDGYEAMIDLFERTDTKFELDVIALCSDFTEATEEEIRSDYSLEEDEDIEQYLSENTWYQILDNGKILYQAF